MNPDALNKLSTTITYWSDQELEREIRLILPKVFDELDNKANQIKAISLIQQLRKRFLMNLVE